MPAHSRIVNGNPEIFFPKSKCKQEDPTALEKFSKKHIQKCRVIKALGTVYTRRYKRTERGRLKAEEYRNRLRNKDPARLRARMAVHHAVEAGVLRRPSLCSRCGSKGNIEGHHHRGYEKEHWLDVVWLCRECHLQEHDNLLTFEERKESA